MKCPDCKGRGRVTLPPSYPPKHTDDTWTDCPRCKGTGKLPEGKPRCPECKGTGTWKNGKNGPMMKCQDCNGTGEGQHFEMIFWRYDQFPYILASRGFMQDNGTAYVPSYSAAFRPCRVLPLDEGSKLANELEALKEQRDLAIAAVHEGFKARLALIASWALQK